MSENNEHVLFPMPPCVGDRYIAVHKPPRRLGSGTYGTVFLYHQKEDPAHEVAIKRFHAEHMLVDGPETSLLREVSLLRRCSGHPSIVQLHNVFIEPMSRAERARLCEEFTYHESQYWAFIVMERLHAPLSTILSSKEYRVERGDVQRWSRQMLEALSYLHSCGIVHRDVKPENLLLDQRCDNIKLADFGLGRPLYVPTQRLSDRCCTLWYRPPELLLGSCVYAMPVDVWSAGCVIAEMGMRGRPLFHGRCQFDQLVCIFSTLGTPTERDWFGCTRLPHWNDEWPRFRSTPGIVAHLNGSESVDADGIDLVDEMVVCDPLKRITAQDALRHPFLAAVPTSHEEEVDDSLRSSIGCSPLS